jgi:Tfp pilus assembly protein PilW
MMTRGSSESGMTMPELLVGMVLTGVVTGLLVLFVATTHRAYRHTDQDSEALGSLRTAIDRVEKEIRQARRVYSDSTGRKLRVWVDSDGDNQQDLEERVTWEVETVSGVGHLTRITEEAGATKRTLVRNLVAADAFSYNSSPVSDATLVTISLGADANTTSEGPGARTVTTKVRLRNADA